MKLIYVQISNYKNLSGLELHLNSRNNFIVGENNLGKSNFLLLLCTLFTRKSFGKDDFTDIQNPIEVRFTLELEEIEIGIFDDFFEPDDSNKITIKAIQPTVEDPIDFWHEATNTRIQPSLVKCLNFLYYDSIRNPSNELSFNKSKGVGKFLHHIILKHLQASGTTDADFVDTTKTDELSAYINTVICKIKAFKQYSISVEVERDVENLLSRILTLKDGNNMYIHQSGYGVQFLAIITLTILQKILETMELKRDRGVYEYREPEDSEEVKKAISLVVGFDEPEIHLHPYLQRSLVKYINRVLTNGEPDFISLLESVFGVSKVIGQSIVVTHSANIILNDYTEIVRFYKKNNILSVKSGSQITIEPHLKKHLEMQFPFIKEAFFSRCAIVVEGATEYSALPSFGLNMGYDFDEYGISVIGAGGKGSAKPIIELLNKFEIPTICIVDRDDDPVSTDPLILQTTKRDFEEEIVTLIVNGHEDILKSIICTYENDPRDIHGQPIYTSYQSNRLVKLGPKYANFIDQNIVINADLNLSQLGNNDLELKKLWYLSWFLKNKDIVLGKVIGETLEPAQIPAIYSTLINSAVLLSNS